MSRRTRKLKLTSNLSAIVIKPAMIQNTKKNNHRLKKRKVPKENQVETNLQINRKNANRQVVKIGHGLLVHQLM